MEKKHLLVVDNDQNLLRTLEFILETANYKVTTAGNGQEALEKIFGEREKNRAVDLLITDIRMPGMTGLELIDELTRREEKIPVVVLTAYGDYQLAAKLRRKGCVDYLDKTLDDDALVKRIDSILIQIENRRISESRKSPGEK